MLLSFLSALQKELHVQRRRDLATGMVYIVTHDLDLDWQDRTVVSLCQLLASELDTTVLTTLYRLIHGLLLQPNDRHLLISVPASYSSLCAAPLHDPALTALVLPIIVIPKVLHRTQSPQSKAALCLLLCTLSKAMPTDNAGNAGDSTTNTAVNTSPTSTATFPSTTVLKWVVTTIEQEGMTMPLLYLIDALRLSHACLRTITSASIDSIQSRTVVAQFVRHNITRNANFRHQWKCIDLLLLYTYCTDNNRNAKQCLNLLWSRPGTGLSTVVSLLLSHSLQVDYTVWKHIKDQLNKSNRISFDLLASGSRGSTVHGRKTVAVLVRYRNQKQHDMCGRLLLKILETTVLMYFNSRENVSSSSERRSNGSSMSLSVLAGVQALVRASVYDEVNRGADVVLIRLARTSLGLATQIVHQLQEIPDSTDNLKRKQRKHALMHRLAEEIEDKAVSRRQLCMPSRPASRSHHRPRSKFGGLQRELLAKRPLTAAGVVAKIQHSRKHNF